MLGAISLALLLGAILHSKMGALAITNLDMSRAEEQLFIYRIMIFE
jgi:hypothetical protein